MSYIGQTLPADTFQGFTTDSFAGDGSATTFTLSKTPFNESALLVVINNVVQKPTTNFTVSGTTLTIVGTAVASGDVIYATHIGGALPIGQAASLDLNGASDQLILDADADTTISADTDDQIDIKIAGADDFQFTANTFTAQSGSTITTPTLGVGNTKDLGSGIHIKTADSGAAVHANGDNLVIEQSDKPGMSFVSGTSGFGTIYFSDGADANAYRGFIQYGHTADQLIFGTSSTTHMKIDSIGAVTKPLQPAFRVKPAGDQSNIAVAAWVEVVFGTEIFDQNADFASNTFTAPVTGRYQFNTHIRINAADEASSYYWIRLGTSNRAVYGTIYDLDGLGADPDYWTLSVSAFTDMDANDTCAVDIFQGSGAQQVDISVYSSFSGYLVC